MKEDMGMDTDGARGLGNIIARRGFGSGYFLELGLG